MSSCVMSVQATAPARVASTARPYRRHHRVAVTAAVGAKRSSAHPGRVAVSCRASTSDTGAEVAEVLDGSSLFLVGMMGTGKSSVGKKLAAALGYNFFDTDDIIESVTKMTIPEIFAEEGEDGFREVETSVLAEVAAYKKCVVATGGGIVKRRENWMHLRNGVVLCLSGPASLLARRVVVGGGKVIVIITKSLCRVPYLQADGAEARPLFKDVGSNVDAIAAKIEDMYKERLEMYANADVQVKLLQAEDGGEEEDLDQIAARALACVKSRILDDDTKQRLRSEPKPGDIKVTGM